MHAAAHKLFIWVFLFTRSTDRNLIKSHEKKIGDSLCYYRWLIFGLYECMPTKYRRFFFHFFSNECSTQKSNWNRDGQKGERQENNYYMRNKTFTKNLMQEIFFEFDLVEWRACLSRSQLNGHTLFAEHIHISRKKNRIMCILNIDRARDECVLHTQLRD